MALAGAKLVLALSENKWAFVKDGKVPNVKELPRGPKTPFPLNWQAPLKTGPISHSALEVSGPDMPGRQALQASPFA